MRVVALVSGGLDSTALLLKLYGHEVFPLYVKYGCKAEEQELSATKRILRHFSLRLHTVEVLSKMRSALTLKSMRVPHRNDVMTDWVPFRNVLLVLLGAQYADYVDAGSIAIGCHKEEIPFPDDFTKNSKSFVERLLRKFDLKSRPWKILLPLQELDKTDIVKMVYSVDPKLLRLTYSCYEGRQLHCGLCDGCENRKKAFKLAGIPDPTTYEK